jgi:glycosyltransferase involved in cell wall biosynthesis
MIPAGGRRLLVLSNLYPSSAFPGSGPFVRDQVRELARRNTLAVVAPLRIAPLNVHTARRVLAVPKLTTEDGIPVTRPWFPGIPVGGYTIEPRLWASRLRPLLRRVYDELPGELVHAHFALPDGYAAACFAAAHRVPLVVTLHGSDVIQLGQSGRLRKLLRRTFAEAQAIVAVSQQVAERAEALGAPRPRLLVIPCGVPYRPALTLHEARAVLGVDDDTVCLLWVGGLVPVKQPLDAIRALAQLQTRAGERRLLLAVAGDGGLRNEMRELVERSGLANAVRLLGHASRDTVWTWQCAADVLINSSRSEGTPLAVLEALGAGTPVVAYPLPGVQAAIEAVNGGRVATESTPAALADAMLGELAHGRDRAGLAATARAQFDIERTCRALEEVYDSVL